MQISVGVLISSLVCIPRPIYPSSWGGGSPGEAELSCGDSGIYGSLLCGRRTTAVAGLFNKVYTHCLVHRM